MVQILNVWVEPVVEVHAELQGDLNRVLITVRPYSLTFRGGTHYVSQHDKEA
jgi:hypothetical protein